MCFGFRRGPGNKRPLCAFFHRQLLTSRSDHLPRHLPSYLPLRINHPMLPHLKHVRHMLVHIKEQVAGHKGEDHCLSVGRIGVQHCMGTKLLIKTVWSCHIPLASMLCVMPCLHQLQCTGFAALLACAYTSLACMHLIDAYTLLACAYTSLSPAC